ncbi:MAG: heavy-metal-associated domain-containing protein [Leptospiraceae bacterium]|nr:heavy-metal-associated domain-containing protein [Leptospiraceae bacterium]MDW8306764.1 heavy metal-associated domain-containing protein [Leptospiraceae bacterium]
MRIHLALLFLAGSLFANKLQKCTVEISGMSCQSCEKAIEKSLRQLPGVEKLTVSFKTGKGELWFSPGTEINEEEIRQAVERAGYKVKNISFSK